MLNLIYSEWTKLRTTASLWWTSGLLIVLPAALVSLIAATAPIYAPLTVVMVAATIIFVILTVQAAMTVTTEYRFGIPATTYRLTPVRWQVAAAKLLLYAVLAALLTLICLAISFVLGDALADVPAGWSTNAVATRALWALPLAAAILVLFMQGLGWLVRNTAGTITLAFGMQFVVESIIGLIPRYGQDIAQYMPFSNLYAFAFDLPTGTFTTWQSLAVFATWAAVLWVAGVVLLEKRDV